MFKKYEVNGNEFIVENPVAVRTGTIKGDSILAKDIDGWYFTYPCLLHTTESGEDVDADEIVEEATQRKEIEQAYKDEVWAAQKKESLARSAERFGTGE